LPKSAITIRRARLSEAGELSDLALRSKAHWGYDAAFMAACRAELTIQPAAIEAGEVWVAEAGEALVGVLEIIPKEPDAELRLIFIAPERIGQGFGAMLWDHAEARARAYQAQGIALDADPNSVGFYERMGMRIVGESPSGSIPGRMLPRMRKALLDEISERVASPLG
jgi:GNAT superfamily N-acetyltransferase